MPEKPTAELSPEALALQNAIKADQAVIEKRRKEIAAGCSKEHKAGSEAIIERRTRQIEERTKRLAQITGGHR